VEEADVPLEDLQEHVRHSAEQGYAAWISWVALSTAILEAMMDQIEASDQWNYYQAKSIKASVLDAKMSLAAVADEKDREKAARYEEEQSKIQSEAEHKQLEAKSNFHQHEVFARGVTMFQIAIAIAAISALTKKRRFWMVSLFFGAAGCVFLILGGMRH
jgi:hypothetical protein